MDNENQVANEEQVAYTSESEVQRIRSIVEVETAKVREEGLNLLKTVKEEVDKVREEGLTLLKAAKEEAKELLDKADTYNPNKNPKAISIIQQADGNWIGEMFKNGKAVSVRQGDPQIVLQMLITHS